MTTDHINALFEKAMALNGSGMVGKIAERRLYQAVTDEWPSIHQELTRLREENLGLKLQCQNYRLSGIDGELQAKADALADAVEQNLKARDDINLALLVDTEGKMEAALLAYRGEK